MTTTTKSDVTSVREREAGYDTDVTGNAKVELKRDGVEKGLALALRARCSNKTTASARQDVTNQG